MLLNFKFFLYAVFTIFISITAYASQNDEAVYVNSQENSFIVYRFESGQYVVEKYLQAQPNGFQDLNWQKRFTLELSAQNFLNKNLNGYAKKNITVVDLLQKNNIETFREDYLTEVKDQVLWQHTQEWSWDWEIKYGEWVTQNITIDFFQKYNIPTDCADLAYIARWIFSRINGLPAANRLGGSQNILSNYSMRTEWLKYPTHKEWNQDRRFLKALEYLMNNTYTHTLKRDSYPIQISKDALLVGTHHLKLHGDSGHTMLVVGVNEPQEAPLRLFYSNVPRVVRPLYATVYSDYSQPVKSEGFLKFLWPTVSAKGVRFKQAVEMPFYSLEQYNQDFIGMDGAFNIAVFKRLQPDFSWEKLIQSYAQDIETRLNDRIEIVKQGYDFCHSNRCDEGSSGYEDWSTPSRDRQIVSIYQSLVQSTSRPEISFLQSYVQEQFNKKIIRLNGVDIKLNSLLLRFLFDLVSFDPTVGLAERWGTDATAIAKNVHQKVLSLLEQRKQFRQKNLCREPCILFSKEWLNASSFDIDQQIKQIFLGITLLKTNRFPEYEELQAQLKTINIEGLSLYEWSEKSALISSDPVLGDLNNFKKMPWSAFGYSENQNLKVSNDLKFAALVYSGGGSDVFTLATKKPLFSIEDAEFLATDFDVVQNRVVAVKTTENFNEILSYQSGQFFKFKLPELNAWVKAYWADSKELGQYLLVKSPDLFAGYKLTGEEIFRYKHYLSEDNLIQAKKSREYFFSENHFCVFELDQPLKKYCLPDVFDLPESISVEMSGNDQLTRFALVKVDGAYPKVIKSVLFNHITKSMQSFDKNKYIEIYQKSYFLERHSETETKTLYDVDSKTGQILKIKELDKLQFLSEIAASTFSIFTQLANGDIETVETFFLKGPKKINIVLINDEEAIKTVFNLKEQVYIVLRLKNGGTRLRVLGGPTVIEFSSTTQVHIVASESSLFIKSTRALQEQENKVLNVYQEIDLITNKIKPDWLVSESEAGNILNRNNSNFVRYDLEQSGSFLPTGFTMTEREDLVAAIKMLGLKKNNVWIYRN